MTALPTTTTGQLASYSDLLTFVTNHLQLDSDTAGQLPSLLRMAEAELERIVLAPDREVSVTLPVTSAVVSLPNDFAEMQSAILTDYYPLSQVTLTVLNALYPTGTGIPQVYALTGGNLILGPTPDAAYSLALTYQGKLTPLTTTSVNWILTSYPDVYVYALMFQAEAYRNNDDRLPGIQSKLAQAVDQVNKAGNRKRNSTPIRLRSPGYVV